MQFLAAEPPVCTTTTRRTYVAPARVLQAFLHDGMADMCEKSTPRAELLTSTTEKKSSKR